MTVAEMAAMEAALADQCVDVFANATLVVGAASVGVVFDDDYQEALDMAGSGPTAVGKSDDLAGCAYGTAVTVDGVAYTVRAIKPDGKGVTRLMLESV